MELLAKIVAEAQTRCNAIKEERRLRRVTVTLDLLDGVPHRRARSFDSGRRAGRHHLRSRPYRNFRGEQNATVLRDAEWHA